ncbi:MAG: type II toxin-antitoxin system VapC family toxin [Gammaproteobacteria bacterium]|nr:MAG: type II toxin-antitoxin system VapC family toxin [Gammaproteobacteria bacterium]
MILVDTSVWVDHLRAGDGTLVKLLHGMQVLTHPFVVGELACGNLHNRVEILRSLQDLPQIPVAQDPEVLFFIERHRLMGCGIGYIDAHLLAATALADPARIWTRDRRLRAAAEALSLAAPMD